MDNFVSVIKIIGETFKKGFMKIKNATISCSYENSNTENINNLYKPKDDKENIFLFDFEKIEDTWGWFVDPEKY